MSWCRRLCSSSASWLTTRRRGRILARNELCFSTSLSVTSEKPAGTEEWHKELTMPGSAGRTFRWPSYNLRVHPPLDELPADEYARAKGAALTKEEAEGNSKRVLKPNEIRPAYVCHMRALIKYSPDKMWYIASLVRGMSVEEAIRQLSFISLKGAVVAKEVIQEAQEIAVRDHHVEFKTNLWVAESFASKGDVIKGVRRHARGRMGEVEYKYTNYFVKLEEGKPPQDYLVWAKNKNPEEWLEWYVNEQRKKHMPAHIEKDLQQV